MENKWDSVHQMETGRCWRGRGLICREGETYKDIYYHVMSVNNCELCNIEFDELSKNQRCMDHCHVSGYFRNVLCRKCNSGRKQVKINRKTGHMWISPIINKRKKVYVTFNYRRNGFKSKKSQSLTLLLCLSYYISIF